MIPANENYDGLWEDDLDPDFEVETEPSLTYAMKISQEISEDSIFVGRADDVKAIEQAIIKIINTERYEYEIYSWDYGVELQDLYGKPMPYVMSEVKQRVIEALTADDRIESVDDFTVKRTGKHTLHLTFTVTTVQEDEFEMESEVEL